MLFSFILFKFQLHNSEVKQEDDVSSKLIKCSLSWISRFVPIFIERKTCNGDFQTSSWKINFWKGEMTGVFIETEDEPEESVQNDLKSHQRSFLSMKVNLSWLTYHPQYKNCRQKIESRRFLFPHIYFHGVTSCILVFLQHKVHMWKKNDLIL